MGGLVKGIFGGGSTPAPVAPPPVPTVDNSQAKLDAAAQAQMDAATRGRTSTILNGGQGIAANQNTTSKIVLGA